MEIVFLGVGGGEGDEVMSLARIPAAEDRMAITAAGTRAAGYTSLRPRGEDPLFWVIYERNSGLQFATWNGAFIHSDSRRARGEVLKWLLLSITFSLPGAGGGVASQFYFI